MTLEQIVHLLAHLNDGDLSRAGLPPYVQENNEYARRIIGDHFGDGELVMEAVNRGRYCQKDKYIICDTEAEAIFTFSTKEELFEFIPVQAIQDSLDDIEEEDSKDWPAVEALIRAIDNTFVKDDIKSVDRMVLENLILYIYDSLHHLNGIFPDWWDREN